MVAVSGAIALGVAGAAAGASAIKGRKARKAQQRANAATRKINQLKNFQAKRQFLRQFRQAQAQNLVTGIAAGVGLGSSRVQGTRSSLQAQAEGAVAEFNLMDKLGGITTANLNRAARYSQQAAMFGQISNFALSFASFSGGAASETAGQVKT